MKFNITKCLEMKFNIVEYPRSNFVNLLNNLGRITCSFSLLSMIAIISFYERYIFKFHQSPSKINDYGLMGLSRSIYLLI